MAPPSLSVTHVQGIFSPEHGGPYFSLANYCRGQVALGHRISVRTLEGYPHTSPAMRLEPPIDERVCPVAYPSRLGASASLRRVLRADPTPDVYHLHGVWLRAMHYGAVEARRRGRPYVVELMGAYEKYPLRQKWLVKWISRHWFQDALLRRAGCLHVNSHHEAQALRKLGFRVPIAVVPVGVDTLAIAKQRDMSPVSPVPCPRPFVLYLARIHSKKGIELLLQAWATLAARFPDHYLAVAGGGDAEYIARCRKLASDLQVEDRCRWLGPVSEAAKSWLFRQAEVYVLPSYSENFGNTVAESLAHATPVVTTLHTPWTSLPEEGCGWIADTTVVSFASAIARSLEATPEERRQMGEIGQRLVERRYSIGSVVRQLDRIYAWLLGGTRPDDILV